MTTVFENIENFHFLRPELLLGLLLLPIIWIALRKRALGGSDWSNAIDPLFLKHLTPKARQQKKHQFQSIILWILAFSFISVAGPSWQEKPQPVIKVADNMVVILDLSLSMLATDTTPTRLVRTKQKLIDLLERRKEGYTALIAFSGDSHVVTPLTDDTNTIAANLPALDPFIMPVIGSRPDLAIEQALQLLDQGKAIRGRILLLTDGVEEHQLSRINEALEGRNISLSILAAGTLAGGPINLPERGYLKDGDRVVIPKTNFNRLENLAAQNKGMMRAIDLTGKDLDALDIDGKNLQERDSSEKNIDKRYDAWEDMGYLLLAFIIPLALIAHRQGVVLVLLLFIIPVDNSFAFGWNDLWKTKNQQAQELLEKGQVEQAAETFASPAHKADARFKAKQYELASEQFSKIDTADAHYNEGNALAYQQKFSEALNAYDAALERMPDHKDAAFNKQKIEEFLEQQSQSSSDQESDQEQQSDQNKEQQSDQSQEKEGKNGDSQQSDSQQSNSQDQQQSNPEQKSSESSDNDANAQQSNSEQEKNDTEQRETENNQNGTEPEDQSSAQAEKSLAQAEQEQLSKEEKQSYEQWMRRVPDDPGGLLRRKFEQQARERNRQAREQGEPLW